MLFTKTPLSRSDFRQQTNIEPDFLAEHTEVTCWYLRQVRGRKWHAFILRFFLAVGEGRTPKRCRAGLNSSPMCCRVVMETEKECHCHLCPPLQTQEVTFKLAPIHTHWILASDILCAPSCRAWSHSAWLERKPEVSRHPLLSSRHETVTF